MNIKFRVWDNGHMFYPDRPDGQFTPYSGYNPYWCNKDYFLTMDGQCGIYEKPHSACDDSECDCTTEGVSPFSKAIPLISTRLRDRKNVEIYEGDIVSTSYGTHPVECKDGNWTALCNDTKLDELLEIEVVGNIYETPERNQHNTEVDITE